MRQHLLSKALLLAALPLNAGQSAPASRPAPAATAPAQPPADLSALLQPLLAKHKLPGMVAALVEGDRVVAIGAVGVRKIGSPDPFTVDDQVHLGSDTKAMTALLIGQLIEQKTLAFDTPMAEIFPELAAGMNPAMAKVTVGQLLNHTGGLPHDLNWLTLGGASLKEQRLAAVKTALAAAPLSPPGTKDGYSNAGYVLLGAILEKKTGLAWEELIAERIFKPLHMTSAGFGPPGTPGKIDQPWGHAMRLKILLPMQFDNPQVMRPAGGVHCSIDDWAHFVSLMLPALCARQQMLNIPRNKRIRPSLYWVVV